MLESSHCGTERRGQSLLFRDFDYLEEQAKAFGGDGIVIVTYRACPASRDADVGGPHAPGDAEPWVDGVEVPLVERKTGPGCA